MRSSKKSQRGYNLIEVLVAVALTGVVILSILTLFFMGKRNVYSGKQLSAANAVATRALEDLSSMSGPDVLANFAITNATTRSNNTIAGVTYASSVLRDTSATADATLDPAGYLARWKTLVAASAFNSGRLVLIITPAQPTVAGSPVSTAQVVRVRGVILWNEGRRQRNITFDSSKLVRQ